MVRNSTSPGPGTGAVYSSMRKSEALGSPTGREARTTRLADWDMMFPPGFSFFVIASEAKQSILAKGKMDCFGRSAPRNDGSSVCAPALHPARIVRAFTRNGDVVDVAFAQARAGDAHELRLLMEFREVARTDIAHRGAQATGELVHDVADRTFIRHLALDALGHQLERILDVLLEVAVGRAARHRADRTHAAIGLVGTALPQKHFAGRLVGAGQQGADHRDVGAGRERLRKIAGIFDAAVCNHGDVGFLRRRDRIHDRSELRHADAGYDARGADRARADADLD